MTGIPQFFTQRQQQRLQMLRKRCQSLRKPQIIEFNNAPSAYTRPELLVIDDFGLRPLTAPGPEDLYDVINERYEKGAILLTSNRAPAEWAGWFTDPLLASAGLDRLAHNVHVLAITGPSFRARGRQQLEQEVTLATTTATTAKPS